MIVTFSARSSSDHRDSSIVLKFRFEGGKLLESSDGNDISTNLTFIICQLCIDIFLLNILLVDAVQTV